MDDIGRCVCGMDGQKYILGPCILSGRLLIHADKKTRLFVEGSSFSDGVISWRFGREYPEKCQHFLTGSALLTVLTRNFLNLGIIESRNYIRISYGSFLYAGTNGISPFS